ncbi:DUF6644 family protein [Sphingomonas sp. MMS24-J13]|uniref:DUF6644 family protein n=1 Tax=Sphingomonas sp. MMS24-J13 TaxID=3238686 RepID=UPI00384D3E89
MLDQIFTALNDSAIGTTIRENGIVFPWIEVVHVMAITIVVGTIALVDLRLVGLASTNYPVSRLTKALLPLTWIAFAIAFVSGALMFSSQPAKYFANFAFRMKMVMLLAAGLNMAVFHLMTMRGISLWDNNAKVPGAAKAAGLISMVIWVTIVALGRWIGFTMSPF